MRAFSMLVLRRDPFCQYPGCDRRSDHAHHPYQRSTHPSLRYRWDLGVGVCGPHHRQIHANPEASYALGLLKRSWEMPDEERSAAQGTDQPEPTRKEIQANRTCDGLSSSGRDHEANLYDTPGAAVADDSGDAA